MFFEEDHQKDKALFFLFRKIRKRIQWFSRDLHLRTAQINPDQQKYRYTSFVALHDLWGDKK